MGDYSPILFGGHNSHRVQLSQLLSIEIRLYNYTATYKHGDNGTYVMCAMSGTPRVIWDK